MKDWKVGETAIVFDCRAWVEVGHDVGDNSCFWRPATIMKTYGFGADMLADVRFVESGKDSSGHFTIAFLQPRVP